MHNKDSKQNFWNIQILIIFEIPNAWRGLLKQDLFKNLKEMSRKPTSESHLISQFLTLGTIYPKWNSPTRVSSLAQNCKSLAFLNKTNQPNKKSTTSPILSLSPQETVLPSHLTPSATHCFFPGSSHGLSFQPCSRGHCLFYSSFLNLRTVLNTIPDFSFPNTFLDPFKREHALLPWKTQ